MFNIHVTHFQTVAFFAIMALSGVLNGMETHSIARPIDRDTAYFQIVKEGEESYFQKIDAPTTYTKGNNNLTRIFQHGKDFSSIVSFSNGSTSTVKTSFPGGYQADVTFNASHSLYQCLHEIKTNHGHKNIKFITFLDAQKEIVGVMTKKLVEMSVKHDDMRFFAPASLQANNNSIDNFITLSALDSEAYQSAIKKIEQSHDEIYNGYIEKNPISQTNLYYRTTKESWLQTFFTNQSSLVKNEEERTRQILEQIKNKPQNITNNNSSNKFPLYIALGGGICFLAFYYLFTKFSS